MSDYYDVPDLLTLMVHAPQYPRGVVAVVQHYARGNQYVAPMHMECAMGKGWWRLKDAMCPDGKWSQPRLALFPTTAAYDETHSIYATPLCVDCAKGFYNPL